MCDASGYGMVVFVWGASVRPALRAYLSVMCMELAE